MLVPIPVGAYAPLPSSREQLVHAMRWGHMLVVRMANTAADFRGTYCSADAFPPEVFDYARLPCGNDASKEYAA